MALYPLNRLTDDDVGVDSVKKSGLVPREGRGEEVCGVQVYNDPRDPKKSDRGLKPMIGW